jgi:hypothetical protein
MPRRSGNKDWLNDFLQPSERVGIIIIIDAFEHIRVLRLYHFILQLLLSASATLSSIGTASTDGLSCTSRRKARPAFFDSSNVDSLPGGAHTQHRP